jgi:hypothetical protein
VRDSAIWKFRQRVSLIGLDVVTIVRAVASKVLSALGFYLT